MQLRLAYKILRKFEITFLFFVFAVFASNFALASHKTSQVSVSISPTSASLQTGATQQFSATVSGTTKTAVTWLVNGTAGGNSTVGTISTSGLYTAPSSVPSGSITVTARSVANTSKSASASVTVAAPAPVSVSISITPTSAALQTGATQQFSATVSGTTNTAVTWLVNGTAGGNSTVGTISAGGLYTAPSSVPSGSITVAAQSQADTTKSASAVLTISAPAPSGPTYALSVSTNSNHSGAVALQGTKLAGNVYVFTSNASQLTNYNPSGITTVCYWLDNTAMSGTATHCESVTPYDFAGSVDNTTTSLANPWNTANVANGTHTITQQVTETSGAKETDTATFSISNTTPIAALSVTTTSLSNATVSSAYSAALSATGGTAPYSWSIISGSLAPGLTLSSGGSISGTPTTAGSYTFTVQAKDSEATPQTASSSLTLTVASTTTPLAVSTTSLPGATVNTAYSTTLAATGGSGSYTWSILSGSLPSGITMSSSGTISGTATTAGSSSFTAEVKDGSGNTATANETLTVSSATASAAIFYSPTSFINTQLPANTPVDPNSASMVANSIGGSLSSQAHLSNESYGSALVYSKSTDKVYSVACTLYSSDTCSVPGGTINFPIPAGVTLPSGTDKNTVFVYTAQDGSPYAGMELDCWVPSYNATNDTWSCYTASLVHNYNGWGTCAEADIVSFHCNGGNAAGFDGGAGFIRPEEIAAGYIPHAIVVAMNNPGTGIACPATHTDRSGTGIPEGGHFFLPASYNIDAQSWPAWVKTVAHALQNYGGYIVDYGGSFEIKGFTDQNSTIDNSITWSSVGVPTDSTSAGDLSMIPWNQVQVETIQWCN